MSLDITIKEQIIENLGLDDKKVEDLTNEMSLSEDLGADSLDVVELVMAFEESFDMEIPDEDAEKLNTIGDIIKYVEDNS